jgi:hypothetical protein
LAIAMPPFDKRPRPMIRTNCVAGVPSSWIVRLGAGVRVQVGIPAWAWRVNARLRRESTIRNAEDAARCC